MFETIVVGTDGSERASKAVSAAAELAARLDARLLVVMAKPVPSMAFAGLAGEAGLHIDAGGLDAEVTKAANQALGGHAELARRLGAKVEERLVAGRPAESLVDVAKAEGADLIVVGNSGMHGARRMLGSVPNSLTHCAECAVLLVETRD